MKKFENFFEKADFISEDAEINIPINLKSQRFNGGLSIEIFEDGDQKMVKVSFNSQFEDGGYFDLTSAYLPLGKAKGLFGAVLDETLLSSNEN